MSSAASAGSVEFYQRTLDQLAAADLVHATETLSGQAVVICERLPEVAAERAEGDPLAPLRARLEQTLALLLPLVGYGDQGGIRAATAAIQVIADEAAAHAREVSGSVAMLTLHNLVWTTTAYALATGRVEALAPIAGVAIADDYDETQSVFEAIDIRHPDLFDRTAGRAYDNLLSWLRAIELRSEVPLLRRDDDLRAALAEAELIAALRFAAVHGDRSYCHVKGLGLAERRVRRRTQDQTAAAALAALFSVGPDELPDRLGELYGLLATADRFGWHMPLFPDR